MISSLGGRNGPAGGKDIEGGGGNPSSELTIEGAIVGGTGGGGGFKGGCLFEAPPSCTFSLWMSLVVTPCPVITSGV